MLQLMNPLRGYCPGYPDCLPVFPELIIEKENAAIGCLTTCLSSLDS